jgi:hypothetical protein
MKTLIRAPLSVLGLIVPSVSLTALHTALHLWAAPAAGLVLFASQPAFAAPRQSAPSDPQVAARRVAPEIGLDAAALAAVGINAEACAAMLQRLVASSVAIDGLDQAKTGLLGASEALEEARQSAQDGSSEAAATIGEREASVQAASSTVAGLRAALRGIALDGVSPAAVAMLNAIDGNRKRRVPTEFMVVTRSDSDWEMLERAIRREGRCQRTGETLEPEYASLLASVRAEPAVAAAALSIASLRPAVEAALVAE